MDRFHIVIANYQRLDQFVSNLAKLKNLNLKQDRIYILDCSPKSQERDQWKQANRLTNQGFHWNQNLFFIKRRNWNLNHGAHQEYLYALLSGVIPVPRYSFFLQDHYLNTEEDVKSDTIPHGIILDLDQIEKTFLKDSDVGCQFAARNGIRTVYANFNRWAQTYLWGDEETIAHLYPQKEVVKQGTHRWHTQVSIQRPFSFYVDGGNFFTKPELYLNHFRSNPKQLISGDGSYGMAHVWEVELGKILFDQEKVWVDLANHISFRNPEELARRENKERKSFSKPWMINRVWYFFYGQHQQPHGPWPLSLVGRYAINSYLPRLKNSPPPFRYDFVK